MDETLDARAGAGLRAHWGTVLAVVVLFVAAAAALGAKRHPEYTAQARLSVGRIFVEDPAAVPGILQANEELAANYSRVIDATPVVARTRRLAGTSAGSVTATPLLGSTLITVSAKASTAASAVRLANAASTALADYVNAQNRVGQNAEVVFSRFRRAALAYRRLLDVQNQLADEYSVNPTDSARSALDRASAAVLAAALRRDTLSASYQSVVQAGNATPKVQPFSRALGATSDRRSRLELLVLIGLVAGLAVGSALALLRGGRRYEPAPVVERPEAARRPGQAPSRS